MTQNFFRQRKISIWLLTSKNYPAFYSSIEIIHNLVNEKWKQSSYKYVPWGSWKGFPQCTLTIYLSIPLYQLKRTLFEAWTVSIDGQNYLKNIISLVFGTLFCIYYDSFYSKISVKLSCLWSISQVILETYVHYEKQNYFRKRCNFNIKCPYPLCLSCWN